MVCAIKMSRDQWFGVNEVFILHRREKYAVPARELMREIRTKSGLNLSEHEFAKLAVQFNYREVGAGRWVAD